MDIYPKQCNHRVSFGSTTRYCGNYARKGKDFCWMHDGTPKKSEQLTTRIDKLEKILTLIVGLLEHPGSFVTHQDLNKAHNVLGDGKGESDG